MAFSNWLKSAAAYVMCFASLPCSPAAAQNPVTAHDIVIGVAAPLSGPFEDLGRQLQAAATAYGAKNGDVRLTVADDRCDAVGGAEAAHLFVDAGAAVATGFLCTEAIEAALPILATAGIPVLTTGVRTDRLRKKASDLPPVFRVPERSGDEARAVARILTREWRSELFAIVDDGTIYARELAESFRLAAETAGLKPAYVDTFRPQLDNQIGLAGRLKKAGVTHLFAAGDRPDIAIIARDAGAIGHNLVIAGGEALLAADGDVPLAPGVLVIAPRALIRAIAKNPLEHTLETSGYWPAQTAAIEIAVEAVQIARQGGRTIREVLASATFETATGPIRFDEDGNNLSAQYGLFRYDGQSYGE